VGTGEEVIGDDVDEVMVLVVVPFEFDIAAVSSMGTMTGNVSAGGAWGSPGAVQVSVNVIVGPSVTNEESVTAGYSKVLVTRLNVLPLSGGTTVKGFA